MYKPNFQKHDVIVFHHFIRKGYALFACLGREVIISVLSVATLSASKAASISDEVWRTDSAQVVKEVWLGDVGVTGSRAPLTKSQAARMVTVLTRDDIQAAPVQSVNDLLKMAVGVDVRQRGALGSQTDISIRGGTQEQIIILLNGINICDPQTGHNVMDLPVQLNEIIRIEVLEGPAGRAYGTSSLAGAINIVTHPKTENQEPATAGKLTDTNLELNLEGGSFGYAKASFVSSLAHPFSQPAPSHFAHQLSGSYQRSDGYSRAKNGSLNTDYSGSKGFYQGCYDDEQVRVSWHLGIADKGWGSGMFYGSSDDQYEHTTKLYSALQAETKQGVFHLRPALYWNQHRDCYEWHRHQTEDKNNYNRTDVYGANFSCWFDSPLGRTALGGEVRHEELVSGNLGEPLFQKHKIAGTSRYYDHGVSRTNLSAHFEHNILLKRLTLSAGFIAAKSSWSSMNMRIYPGIDASYRVSERMKIFASWNTSLRLPSFTEMYYKLQGYAADPHLKPEEMQAVEAGTQFCNDFLDAKVTFFYHHGRNMIDWIKDTSKGESAMWKSVNHTRINVYGLDVYTSINLRFLFPSQQLMRTFSINYGYLSQDKELEPFMVSQYTLEYLRHKMVARLSLSPYSRLTLDACLRWQDRTGHYTDLDGKVADYRPYALLDARLQWQAKGYQLYAQANNLLDNRNYTDFGNVTQPGAWFTAGVLICIK